MFPWFWAKCNLRRDEGSVSVILDTYQSKDYKIDTAGKGETGVDESGKGESSEERANAKDAEETSYVGKTLGLFRVADDIAIQALMEEKMESKFRGKTKNRKKIHKDGTNPGGFPNSQ